MKLMNGVLRPGKVLEVLDLGEVKCSAPGLFTEEDATDLLPPIRPWFGHHSSTFSKPKVGDEVWVVNFTDNPMELFWVRKFTTEKTLSDLMSDDESIEILAYVPSGDTYASIYFTDSTGWIIKNDGSIVEIDANGNIYLTSTGDTNIDAKGDINIKKDGINRDVVINSSGVYLGTTSGTQPAVLGTDLQQLLTKISTVLTQIATTSLTDPYLVALSPLITPTIVEINTAIPLITSNDVKLI